MSLPRGAPSGQRLSTEVPAREDGGEPIQVEGGAGGTVADIAEMVSVASVLSGAGSELLDTGERVAAIASDPALLPGALVDPTGYADVQQILVPVAAMLGLEGARVGVLGAGVRAAAMGYAATEAATEWLLVTTRNAIATQGGKLVIRALATPYGWVAVAVPVTVWVAVRTCPLVLEEHQRLSVDLYNGNFSFDSLDDRALRIGVLSVLALEDDVHAAGAAASAWAMRHPEAAQHLVGAAPSAMFGYPRRRAQPPRLLGSAGREDPPIGRPPRSVRDLAWLLSIGGALVYWPSRDIGAAVRPVAPPTGSSPPAGVRDLLARAVPYTPPTEPTASVTPSTYTPGRIRVDRLDTARGTSWVVTLPPTQSWSVAGSRSPFDATTNTHLMAGLPAASSRATTDAMQAAGVRPGQPVMLVGYSQGGLTALQLASDPLVRQRFDVTSVLTAGAPTGGFQAPDGVDVLALEHDQDMVVMADGKDNPDDPTWTTVRRDLLSGAGADGRVAAQLPDRPWAAHHLLPYLGTASMVDGSADESVRAWMRSAAPFLAAPGTTATMTEYAATRD